MVSYFKKERCFVPQHDKTPMSLFRAICHAEVRSISTKNFLKINMFLLFFISTLVSCKQKTLDNQAATESQSIKKDTVELKTEEEVRNPTDDSVTQTAPVKNEMPASKTTAAQNVSVEIFSNDTTADAALKGYGYNILMDGKMYVHQPHIPAVPGSKGFASVADAKKAGVFIKYKVEHHIMPPSVTVQELDSLRISWK